MNCIKHKRFLFWKWKAVEHTYKIWSVSKFMSCSTDFIVKHRCESCGAVTTRHFVKQDELILAGIPVNELNKVDDFNYYYPQSPNP